MVLIGTLISACGTAAAAPPSRPSPCPPDSNVYADNIDQQIVNIYENGVAYFNDKGVYNNYRQQAFNELLNQIYISTDSVDISTGDKTIRITITYISPELIHLIIINHYLYKGIINFTGRLNEQVRNQISRIINRNEHIFL